MADAAATKKRPRVDLLASLDAAFAAKKAAPASKYTAQAAVKEAEANSQQAYLHKKRKNKGGKASKGSNNHQQQHGTGSNSTNTIGAGGSTNSSNTSMKEQAASSDPLYAKLNVEILRVGLKNCSLLPQAKTLNKPYVLSATLKSYLETLTRASSSNSGAAADKLKNKVLQLDNPVKTTDAVKSAHSYAQAQSAKLLSARQRRKLGLHLLKDEMNFSDAEQLCAIWRRYARDVVGTDGDDAADEVTRNTRVQSKLKTLDLSGCPVEVVRSQNPCTIGTSGIVIAEKQQVLQICTPANKIITLPKQGSRFRVALDDRRTVLIEGEWLLKRVTT